MLKQKVLNTIKKYNLIESGDTVIIGVSGGPDSICLLHVLNEIKGELDFKICVAHVNHMLREEADEETKYVEEFCKTSGIECYVKKIDIVKIAKELKKGTEETGRNERYKFFDSVAQICQCEKDKSKIQKFDEGKIQQSLYIPTFLHSYIKIATAHNNNDKIETIIMNILRGSGTSGLKGIEPMRNNKYIKPLIEIDREEIEEYCNENNLNPKHDKSNDENTYTRNKIRNVVIPYIKEEFNPNIFKTLNRLSEVVEEEDEYLNKITQRAFDELVVEIVDPVTLEEILQNDRKNLILDLKKFKRFGISNKKKGNTIYYK